MYAGLSIAVLLPRAVPAAGRRLLGPRGRFWRRCPRPSSCSSCPSGPARWPTASGRASSWAAGRWWPPRACSLLLRHRRRRGLRERDAPGAARLLARPLGHRRAAHRDRAGRRRRENAGIASGVNNAVARAAGLLGVAAMGAVVAAQFAGELNDRSTGRALTAGAGRVRVAEERTLARADVSGLPPGEARARGRGRGGLGRRVPRGMGISAALVPSAACSGSRSSATRAATCRCEGCAGGQLVRRRPRPYASARAVAARRVALRSS